MCVKVFIIIFFFSSASLFFFICTESVFSPSILCIIQNKSIIMCKITGKSEHSVGISTCSRQTESFSSFLNKNNIFHLLKSSHVFSVTYTFSVITKNTLSAGLKQPCAMYTMLQYFIHFIIYMALLT